MRRDRRGVAMLLAMVAVGTSMALASSYLTARDSTPTIGVNAASRSGAEASAEAGAALGLALLQTSADWKSAANASGLLFAGAPIGGATVDVYVTDMAGGRADAADQDLLLTAIAVRGGIRAVAQRVVQHQASPRIDQSLDGTLGEFAVFGSSSVRLDDGAVLAPWARSPSSMAGKAVKIGVGFTGSAGLVVGNGARLSSAALYVPPGATSALLAQRSSPLFVAGEQLAALPPVVHVLAPFDAASLPLQASAARALSGAGQSATLAPGRHRALTVREGAVATIGPGDYAVEQVIVQESGVLRISGRVRLLVQGNLMVRSLGAVELADAGSSVDVHLTGALDVDDAGVGVDRAVARDEERGVESVASYTSPARVAVYAVPPEQGGVANSAFRLVNGALVVGVVHAPGDPVELDGATLIGRVAASSVRVTSGGSLLYDPALDNNAGWTSRGGPLYTAEGALQPGVSLALSSFWPGWGARSLGTYTQAMHEALATAGLPTAPGAPTPRRAGRAAWRAWPATALALERGAGSGNASVDAALLVDADGAPGPLGLATQQPATDNAPVISP